MSGISPRVVGTIPAVGDIQDDPGSSADRPNAAAAVSCVHHFHHYGDRMMVQQTGHCLADAKAGDRVVVRRNLLVDMHLHSDTVVLSRGDQDECVDNADRRMRLRTRAGSDFWIDRFFACLVEVDVPGWHDTVSTLAARA